MMVYALAIASNLEWLSISCLASFQLAQCTNAHIRHHRLSQTIWTNTLNTLHSRLHIITLRWSTRGSALENF